MTSRNVFVASIILGIYASDLHKGLLNTPPILWGSPLSGVEYSRLVDVIFASLCLVAFLLILIVKKNSIQRLINFPVWTQILLICLMTISLMEFSDNRICDIIFPKKVDFFLYKNLIYSVYSAHR